jgi:soluble lytic murein transglycosylase-like protein
MKIKMFNISKSSIMSITIFLLLAHAYSVQGSIVGNMFSRSFVADTKQELISRSVSYSHLSKNIIKENSGRPNMEIGVEKSVATFSDLIESSGKKHKIESDLIKAVIEVESGGNPMAVSPSGAAGLMQLMPITAKELGVTDRFDPEQNIESGTRYLRQLLDRFGSTELALWAYNAGPSAVKAGRMPLETQEYVPRVLLLKKYFSTEVR